MAVNNKKVNQFNESNSQGHGSPSKNILANNHCILRVQRKHCKQTKNSKRQPYYGCCLFTNIRLSATQVWLSCDYYSWSQGFSDDSYTPTKNCNENVEKYSLYITGRLVMLIILAFWPIQMKELCVLVKWNDLGSSTSDLTWTHEQKSLCNK